MAATTQANTNRILTHQELQDVADITLEALADQYTLNNLAYDPVRVVVSQNRRSSYACVRDRLLVIADYSRRQSFARGVHIVCHELAHLLAPPSQYRTKRWWSDGQPRKTCRGIKVTSKGWHGGKLRHKIHHADFHKAELAALAVWGLTLVRNPRRAYGKVIPLK